MTAAADADDRLWGVVLVVTAVQPWTTLLVAGLLARRRQTPRSAR